MNKRLGMLGALSGVGALIGALPPAAASVAPAGTESSEALLSQPAPLLASSEAAKAYLRSLGISPTRIAQAAAALDLDVSTYLHLLARNSAEIQQDSPTIELIDGRFRYNATVAEALGLEPAIVRSQ